VTEKSSGSHLVSGDDVFSQPGTFSVFDAQLSVKREPRRYVAGELATDDRQALMFMFRIGDRPYLSARAIAYPENGAFSIATNGTPSHQEAVAEDQIARRIDAYRKAEPVDGGFDCHGTFLRDPGE
jgi:hypothetical protein